MGKDREGTFHPRKGRPSEEGTTKGFDSHAEAKAIENQLEIEEKLSINELGTPDIIRHPNRKKEKTRRRETSNTRIKSVRTSQPTSASMNRL